MKFITTFLPALLLTMLTSLTTSVLSSTAFAKLEIVTTTSDLGAVVEAVTKGRADVLSIGKGTQDPHHIDAKPSYMVKMRDADFVFAQGLELESAWILPLIQGSRNPKIAAGTSGFVELGELLDPIEVPNGTVTRAQGDVHPGGNPHFQVDPIRLGKAAVIIADRLSNRDADNAEFFKQNAEAFKKDLETKSKDWQARINKTGVKDVVTYHKSLSYFFDRYGLQNHLQLEPRPGIPPTASHLVEVINEMKKHNVNLILIENIFDDSSTEKIKNEIPNLKVFRVPISVGGEPSIKTNADLIEAVVKSIESSVDKSAPDGQHTAPPTHSKSKT